jgi:hypothetical protein
MGSTVHTELTLPNDMIFLRLARAHVRGASLLADLPADQAGRHRKRAGAGRADLGAAGDAVASNETICSKERRSLQRKDIDST